MNLGTFWNTKIKSRWIFWIIEYKVMRDDLSAEEIVPEITDRYPGNPVTFSDMPMAQSKWTWCKALLPYHQYDLPFYNYMYYAKTDVFHFNKILLKLSGAGLALPCSREGGVDKIINAEVTLPSQSRAKQSRLIIASQNAGNALAIIFREINIEITHISTCAIVIAF